MNQALSMGQAPAIRASRALRSFSVRRMCVRALALARRKSLTFAVISVISTYAGLLLDNDPIICASASFAISFVCLADSTQKGGAK